MKLFRNLLVTGAGGPAATNVIKSLKLASNGFNIIGTDINKYRGFLTRADKFYVVHRADDPLYIADINHIIEEENIDLVMPQPDIEVKYLGASRNNLLAPMFLPSQRTINICQNKFNTAFFWEKAGITVPRTAMITCKADIKNFTLMCEPPYWVRSTAGAGGTGSTKAESYETIIKWYEYWQSRNSKWNFIIQEYLPGRNIAWHSLWNKGKLITSMARQRLEYIYPYLSPSGVTGTPTVQITIRDRQVNKIATKAVKAIDNNYTGIACVDLKCDIHDVPNPTEINPGRMFTTSYFFSALSQHVRNDYGGNFPYLLTKLALRGSIDIKLPKYNVLPKDYLYIRHIDMNAVILKLNANGNLHRVLKIT